MGEERSPAKCYCVIPNGSQSAVLARNDHGRYEFPFVLLPWQRLKFFPDYITHIRQELCRETNLDTTVLRHLKDAGYVQTCLMEIRSVVGPLPDGYLWLDSREGGNIEWVDEPSSQAWQAWKSLLATGDNPPALAPWERNGWFEDASLWVQTRLREAGYGLNGPVEQLKGAWSWSSILKTETDRGTIYFKAGYDRPPKEVAVILKLAERWPRNVPHVIASDVERGWMLLSDFAGASLETAEADHFLDVVTLFAKLQQSTVPDISDWKRLGCPDMTPANLLRLTRRLIADTAVLCGGVGGLSREEMTELELKTPQMEQMLTQLASSALPDTISNEDFRAGNVAVCGIEPVFYDWGNTVITHPMFGINYFLNRMIRPASEDRFRWRNGLEDEGRRALMSAFLSRWTDYASWDRLSSEFWLCRRLCSLYEAVKCYCDLPFVGTTSPWGAGSLANIPQAMRNLIAALDYQPMSSGVQV